MSTRPRTEEVEQLLLSLSGVGPKKPIGYLPLYTLRDIARLKPELVAADAVALGLAAAQFDPDECCIKSGALYVYDRLALSAILRGWASTLEAEQIPSDPDRFVAYVAANWLELLMPPTPS
jgi:hypothetical protein